MEQKILYTLGNLYTGYPWAVEAERHFGTVEMHGPFAGENEANNYMHDLVAPERGEQLYVSLKVVRIETPQAGKRIVRSSGGGFEYAV